MGWGGRGGDGEGGERGCSLTFERFLLTGRKQLGECIEDKDRSVKSLGRK
jgi:hypothetical protein